MPTDTIVPEEALNFLRAKQLKPAFSYEDVWLEEHANNFTVAKAMQLDVLQDFKDAIDLAIENGQTLDQFQKEITPTLMRKGWWGKKTMVDPADGKEKAVRLGSDRRLKTIYNVNTRQAYNAGRWERGQRSAAHTHIMYLVGPSTHHRKEHLSWNGLVLPKDHPFWNTHTPMNGWGCKCYFRYLTKQRLEKLRNEGMSDNTNIVEGRPSGTIQIKENAPDIQYRRYINKRSGRAYTAPAGIDPGFEWNPGSARGAAVSSSLQGKVKTLQQSYPATPKGVPVSEAFSKITPSYKTSVNRALTAINKVHGDGKLPKIPIQASRSKQFYGAFEYSRYSREASAIKLASKDHPELTLIHEIGHFLDNNGLPGKGFCSELNLSEIIPLMKAIDNSNEIQVLKALPSNKSISYLLNPAEQFARAYAQYIAWKTQDPTLILQLKGIQLNSGNPVNRCKQWNEENFLPIAAEFDILFKKMGWL